MTQQVAAAVNLQVAPAVTEQVSAAEERLGAAVYRQVKRDINLLFRRFAEN